MNIKDCLLACMVKGGNGTFQVVNLYEHGILAGTITITNGRFHEIIQRINGTRESRSETLERAHIMVQGADDAVRQLRQLNTAALKRIAKELEIELPAVSLETLAWHEVSMMKITKEIRALRWEALGVKPTREKEKDDGSNGSERPDRSD